MTRRWNWGLGVTLVYSCFALGTLGMVTLASSNTVDLVSEDYYAQSLLVDGQMAATRRGDAALGRAAVAGAAGARQVVLEWRQAPGAGSRGVARWYRPSDAARDRTRVLAGPADFVAPLSMDGLEPGRWRLQLQWTSSGQDYYAEREVVVP